MTSAIMNPCALPVVASKIAEKRAEIAASGIILPEDMDDETFVSLFGMGSTKSRAGKEMEAIRAANFLMNNDPSGGEWIRFNRPPSADGEGRGGRRAGGRRR
jgi:5-methyltetrahydrofolate--homocysteine methyltransferase